MEVVAIMLSLAGMGVAVTMALRDERRDQARMAECLAKLGPACRRTGHKF